MKIQIFFFYQINIKMYNIQMQEFSTIAQISKNHKLSMEIQRILSPNSFINSHSFQNQQFIHLIPIQYYSHFYSVLLQNLETTMEYTNDQFNEIMINLQFKKNQSFKSDPKNLERTISYIRNMKIDEKAFEITEYLIKEFGISILLCFQPFYQKIIKSVQVQAQFKQKLERLSALVIYVVAPNKCGELNFFTVAGTAKKGFKVKDKTPDQLQFIKELQFVRSCIVLKKENATLENIPKERQDQLNEIRQKIIKKSFNPFASYYLKKMLQKLGKQFTVEKIEGSTAEETPQQTEFKKKPTPLTTIDCATVKFQTNNQSNSQNQKLSKQTTIKENNYEIKKNQQGKTTTNNKGEQACEDKYFDSKKQKSEASTKPSSIYSFESPMSIEDMESYIKTQKDREKQRLQRQERQRPVQTKIKPTKNSIAKDQTLSVTEVNTTKQFFLSNGYGLNFALIPLCCRTYFFDQQRILPGEDKRIEYKSYRFPFSPASIQTFKKTICAFLNTIGGQVYIGIKQTTNKKYRYILGNYLTQNDKEEVLKSFRKISEAIYPNVTRDLSVQFVPVRQSPFSEITLLNQIQTYYYDFSKKDLNLDICPYRPARYVIRVRVPMGIREQMYSYVETEYQLNKNSTSSEFVPFRSQNQVLVKEISQEVLKKFKEKLIYGQQKDYRVHQGPCLKPQMGNPRNEPEPQQQMIDAKQIEAPLYNQKRKGNTYQKLESIEEDSGEYTASESSQNQTQDTSKSFSSNAIVTQQELRKIFKYPLNFIALRISKQRLKKCIDKTPAKDYTLINLQKNELTGQDLLLIRVDAYSHMQQFLRVKAKIQSHFSKDKVEFVGISKTIRLQNMENRRVAEELIQKYNHKHTINNKNLEFNSITISASYFLYMRHLGYRVEPVQD